MRQSLRRFTADFETVTWLENETYVWLWAVCEIDNIDNVEWGIDMESFLDWCKYNGNNLLYFHNLKFDGEFIISYLLSHGYECINGEKGHKAKTFKTLISDMGQFFEIKIYFTNKQHITIYDSFKLIPFPVEDLPKGFGIDLKKLDIDYNTPREKGYVPNKQEIDYVLNDVKIPALALGKLFEFNLNHMTIAGNALHGYKSIIGRRSFEHFFPILKYEYDKEIRKSYRGGFTFLNEIYKGCDVDEGVVLDVNSLYPSVLYSEKLPIGEPKFFYGKYEYDDIYDLYVQKITCAFKLKPGKIPTIQIKDDIRFRSTEYLKDSNGWIVALTLTNVDLELFLENYELSGEKYQYGFKFRSIKGLFTKYIDKWSQVKIEAKQNNNKAFYTIAKLMLNSLYGKFGLALEFTSKTPYLKEGVVHYKDNETEIRDGIYIPLAAFVTAYARDKTIRSSQAIKDYSINKYNKDMYIYSDTDSIHTTLPREDILKIIDVDEYKLGLWKIENKFRRAKFVRQKTYVEEIYNDKIKDYELKITCAGMSKGCYSQVTFENFNEELTVYGKLEYKHVQGGVKLVESPFTIKKNTFIVSFKK